MNLSAIDWVSKRYIILNITPQPVGYYPIDPDMLRFRDQFDLIILMRLRLFKSLSTDLIKHYIIASFKACPK